MRKIVRRLKKANDLENGDQVPVLEKRLLATRNIDLEDTFNLLSQKNRDINDFNDDLRRIVESKVVTQQLQALNELEERSSQAYETENKASSESIETENGSIAAESRQLESDAGSDHPQEKQGVLNFFCLLML